MIFEYFLVGILAFFAGGWAIPAGLSFDLPASGVWAATMLGSTAGLVVMAYLAGRSRDALLGDRRVAEGPAPNARAQQLFERWGVVGLALVGTVLAGPTVTTIAALALGVDRRRFIVWSIVATATLTTVLTVAWSAIL